MVDELTAQMIGAMQKYSYDVQQDIEKSLRKISREARKMVSERSPDGRRSGKTKYKEGWTAKFTAENGQISFVIHQKNQNYRLTHLLEDGHRTRTGGSVPARPHIRPVEEWAEEEARKAIEKAVSK